MKRLDFSLRNLLFGRFKKKKKSLKRKEILVWSLLVSSLLLVFDSTSQGHLACMHTAHMGLIKSL